jgi:hypothetical protein
LGSRKALNLLGQLSSLDESKSGRARDALWKIVDEATEKEIQTGKRLQTLETIESELAKVLSDPGEMDGERKEEFLYSLFSIVKALAKRARAVVPALCDVFLHADPGTPLREASETLALIVFKNGNSNALDALISGTDHDNKPEVRQAAVEGLGLLGRSGANAQPRLRGLLNDDDLKVQKAAILALGNQRDRALPVVNDLVEMLKKDGELTDFLQHAVEMITGKPSPINWPRKSSMLYFGSVPFDDPMYSGGWNFILSS